MKIGIVGSDDRAVAIGRLLQSGGHQVTFSDPSNPQAAREAAAALGVETEIPYHQAMQELLILAVRREELDPALRAIGAGAEAVIVDAIDGYRGTPGQNGAELLSHQLNTHRIVRAVINLPAAGSTVSIYGDDDVSKNLLGRALRESGCATNDRGPLTNAAELAAAA